jgi:hypothetical protein
MLARASIIQKAKSDLECVELHVEGRGRGFGRRGCDESERDPQRWEGLAQYRSAASRKTSAIVKA